MVGVAVRLIGFDDDDEIAGWSGVKHHVYTLINTVTPLLLGLGDADHHTCVGDSGGPAVMGVNGVTTIIGVTSCGGQKAPAVVPTAGIHGSTSTWTSSTARRGLTLWRRSDALPSAGRHAIARRRVGRGWRRSSGDGEGSRG
ncbi:trypsin-like serine protease [Sorangium sp. So ce1151]|uniref:trypsin-like serine protease n=1 Tax=Sorangium sp. So ce1151 TaxID=3133332 RepID=UPI003F5E7F58